MQFPLLLPLVLPAVYALAEGSACKQVTNSICEPVENIGLDVASEADCRDVCDVYASSGLGCSFAAWAESATSDKCLLYDLPFSTFLQSCKKVGGPPDLTGCDVERPHTFTCDAVRDGECFYHGDLVQSVDNLDSWESCMAYCSLSPGCEAWTFQAEPSLECRLFATDDRTCIFSYAPTGVDLNDCDEQETGLSIAGGVSSASSEFWGAHGDLPCSLPDLDRGLAYNTLDSWKGTSIACSKDSCDYLSSSGWQHWRNTLYSRQQHTSAVTEEGLVLVGGVASPLTIELLLWEGGESMEIFTFNWGWKEHCSIQTSPTTIVLSGGTYGTSINSGVTEFSGLGAGSEVTSRGLPGLLYPRAGHACGSYNVGDSQVLLVAGGYMNHHEVASTEVFPYTGSSADSWRKAGSLPSPRYGLRAAKVGDLLYATGGANSGATGPAGTMGEILTWDSVAESWSLVGHMTYNRSHHGVTELSLAAVADYCPANI